MRCRRIYSSQEGKPMSRRRSNSRARKERNSVAPPPVEAAPGPTTETISMIRLTTSADEVTAVAPPDEMAELDAGWDDVAS
jgi:hypothetical protein